MRGGPTLLDTIADVLAYSAIIPISLFIYFYGTRLAKGHTFLRKFSRLWLLTQVGRTLMFQMIAWLAYLIFIAFSLLFPEWTWGRDVLRFVIYSSMVLLFWEFFLALRRLQKQENLNGNDFGVTLDNDVENTRPSKPTRSKIKKK